MPVLTLKVSRDFQTRVRRLARQRRMTVSALVRSSVEKEMPPARPGFLLGACAEAGIPLSTFDPSAPAFPADEWESAP